MTGKRMTWTRKIVNIGLAALTTGALLVASVGSALAGTVTTTSGVVGGALTMSNGATASLNTTLNGLDLVVSGDLGALTVADATGSGQGWNLTVTGTSFTANGKALPNDALTITGITVVKNAGKVPANTIGYPVAVPLGASAPTAVKFFSASADSGMGKFTITPAVALSVPAETYAGSYSSTITLSVVAGP